MNISAQILKYRKNSGLTQEQLAADLGVSPQSVSNWERGGSPDISMLPVLAGYFQITIDELMGYSPEINVERRHSFWRELDEIPDPAERLQRLLAEHRRFPKDWVVKHRIISVIEELEPDQKTPYRPFYEELCTQFYKECHLPDFRDSAIAAMCRTCRKEDRELWLGRLPRRGTLRQENVRGLCYTLDGAYSEAADWNDLVRVLELDEFFLNRTPDQTGPKRKAETQRKYIAVLNALCKDGDLPEAWIGVHGYETLVLSACLFGGGENDEAWLRFSEAVTDFERWFRIPSDALLPTGFGEMRITKDRHFAMFPDKKREYIGYCTNTFACVDPKRLLSILNDRERWAWLDPAREDPRFHETVHWAESLINTK